jgi:hypothetical protein
MAHCSLGARHVGSIRRMRIDERPRHCKVIVAARLTEPEAIIAPAAGVYAETSKPMLTLAHRERLPQEQAAMSLHYCSV